MNANGVMLNGLQVLAVDDDADCLDLLALMLGEYGIEVTAVASASEALEIFAQLNPDLLIFDISMPKIDGCTQRSPNQKSSFFKR